MKKFVILCLLCFAHSLYAVAETSLNPEFSIPADGGIENPDTLKVLFVGNSFTYFWGMAQIIEGLSGNGDLFLSARTSTASGASLNDHWHGRYNLHTVEKIKNGNWDVVVIQNQSRSSIDSLDQFMKYGKMFIELIKSEGAIPLLFETWASKDIRFMQDMISGAYKKLAKETNTQIVPIGSLWQKAKELQPGIDLYDSDGNHPNTTGTYFNACIFYAFLTGNQASYLQTRVYTVDHHGETIQLTIQNDQVAMFLQSVIDTYLTTSLFRQ